MKLFAVVLASTFAMGAVACGKKAPEAGGTAAATAAAGGGDKGGGGGDTGAPNCDKYLNGMKACMEKMPEAARGAVADGMKQTQEAWKAITDKGALDAACKQALDTAKTAMGQMCPDAKWE